jgi:Zn-finger nucleic acid-binding protein
MQCPRDNTELKIEHTLGIEVDHCPACNGRWLDHHELDHLEATTGATESERRATIEFGEKQSELACPKCEKTMRTFNYRAYNLELDTCPDEHGYWLDAGEEGRVRDIIEDRVRGLERSATAEASWGKFLGDLKRGKGGGLFGRR